MIVAAVSARYIDCELSPDQKICARFMPLAAENIAEVSASASRIASEGTQHGVCNIRHVANWVQVKML